MPNLLDRLNSPLATMLLAGTALTIFAFGRLYQTDFDFSSFVLAGDRYCDTRSVPSNLRILPNSSGYDGQFYYRLALDPITTKQKDFGITLDSPAVRHQRILYPFLTWLISLADTDVIPVVMVLINFVALWAMAWLGGSLSLMFGRHALWGIFFPLYPGFLFTFSRDLVEIVEVALLLASLLFLIRGKSWTATVLLVLAILSKETALLVAAAAGLVYLFERVDRNDKTSVPFYYFAVPAAAFIVWQTILYTNWGAIPVMTASESAIAVPFSGIAGVLTDAVSRRMLIGSGFLSLVFAATLFSIGSTPVSRLRVICFFLYATLAVSLSREIWIEDVAFLRAASEFYIFGALVTIAATGKYGKIVFAGTIIYWGFLAQILIRHF